MVCNRQCKSVNALPGHSSLRAWESSLSHRVHELIVPTQKLSNWRESMQKTEKKKKLLLFKKGCFSENKSLNHAQEISGYLAMFSQFQWCYSELFASFLIYQLNIKKHLLFHHLFHTWQIQSHMKWNKLSSTWSWKKCIHRIKPEQHPPLCSFPVKTATQYIKHVEW